MNEEQTKQPAVGIGSTYWKQDSRPQRGWWAPGDYLRTCIRCKENFIGDKRAGWCADCAYREAADDSARAPVEGQIARSCSATGSGNESKHGAENRPAGRRYRTVDELIAAECSPEVQAEYARLRAEEGSSPNKKVSDSPPLASNNTKTANGEFAAPLG